jgi:apolipoprotein D and lipocalin family protein
VGDVTATYTLMDDGTVRVVNRCRNEQGEWVEAVGKARLSGDAPAKLEVRFAPAVLSFLPFVWGKYWVIDLAADYSYAVVGEPGREYLWILSRNPSMAEDTYAAVVGRLRARNYDVTRLLKTKQAAQ